MVKKKRGFTLIELIAVLVIMAILALIVVPLVMSIIRKARISADKRSIDAYGRSIELAVASYLLDTGKFPTSIEDLTIEYGGNQVVCETTQLNSDSSVYLAGCTVAGRSVDYTYGKYEAPTYAAYSVGDPVTYNNVDYYVLEDSGTTEASITLLKKTPLTVSEVNQYGMGHINRYSQSEGNSNDNNGYGGMAYYRSEACGYYNENNDEFETIGCTTDYVQSEVKYAVDAWKIAQAPAALSVRLITIDDLEDNLGYVQDPSVATQKIPSPENTPSWVYNSNYTYWTMSQYEDSSFLVWSVGSSGIIETAAIDDINNRVVRPVIVLSKSELN